MQAPTPNEGPTLSDPRRKVLASAIGAILQENGFHSAEKAAIGTLTEMLQSCMYKMVSLYIVMC